MESRRRQRIKRRVYNVKGPHHLWHLDGNHKLKDFHLVIHGCIDGFSRNVIYLRVIDNNNANTVLDYFVQGTRTYIDHIFFDCSNCYGMKFWCNSLGFASSAIFDKRTSNGFVLHPKQNLLTQTIENN